MEFDSPTSRPIRSDVVLDPPPPFPTIYTFLPPPPSTVLLPLPINPSLFFTMDNQRSISLFQVNLFFFFGFWKFCWGLFENYVKVTTFFLFGFHYVQFMADEGLVPWLEDYLYGLGINIYAVIISTSLNSSVNFGNLTHNHIWIMSWIYYYLYIYFIIIFSHGFVLFAEGTQGFCDPNPTNMLIMRKWSQM